MKITEQQVHKLIHIANMHLSFHIAAGRTSDELKSTVSLLNEIINQQSTELKEIRDEKMP